MDTPQLHAAVDRNDLLEVQRLLQADSRLLHTHNLAGQDALLRAARKGHTDLARCLLDLGADVRSCSHGGRSALFWACYGGHAEMVELLLTSGADAGMATELGYTALHVASAEGHAQGVVSLLLTQSCVDIDSTTPEGETALWWASHNGHTDVLRILLQAAADSAISDVRGRDPCGATLAAGNQVCLAVLQDSERQYILTRARRLHDTATLITRTGPSCTPAYNLNDSSVDTPRWLSTRMQTHEKGKGEGACTDSEQRAGGFHAPLPRAIILPDVQAGEEVESMHSRDHDGGGVCDGTSEAWVGDVDVARGVVRTVVCEMNLELLMEMMREVLGG